MKLSEAILEGCSLIPVQATGHYFSTEEDGTPSCCVLGAALIGKRDQIPLLVKESYSGGEMEEIITILLKEEFDVLSDVEVYLCPICGRPFHLFGLCSHLNDREKWTREQIASWLKGQGL